MAEAFIRRAAHAVAATAPTPPPCRRSRDTARFPDRAIVALHTYVLDLSAQAARYRIFLINVIDPLPQIIRLITLNMGADHRGWIGLSFVFQRSKEVAEDRLTAEDTAVVFRAALVVELAVHRGDPHVPGVALHGIGFVDG